MSRDKYITFKSFSPFQIIHIYPPNPKAYFPLRFSNFFLTFHPFPSPFTLFPTFPCFSLFYCPFPNHFFLFLLFFIFVPFFTFLSFPLFLFAPYSSPLSPSLFSSPFFIFFPLGHISPPYRGGNVKQLPLKSLSPSIYNLDLLSEL